MHEITLTRRDTAKGFANTPIIVSVNSSQRRIHNGQTIVLLEAVPASVKVYLNDILIWEGSAKPGNRGIVSLNVGISEKTATRLGLEAPVARPRSNEVSAQDSISLSPRAARIKKVIDENHRHKRNAKAAFIAGFISILVAIGGVIGASDLFIIIGSIAAVIFIWAGINHRSAIPAVCSKCNAPTAKRIDYSEQVNGVRSVQRIIRNQTTNQNEQRTVTVSDIDVVEKWICVTCDHAWTHRYSYSRE
ncbi:TPA: hypothetical protein ACHTCR_004725 [Pseudomonas putida]|uniref:hypothetical protein n=1 Tax=Pseudomonas putida TaxID=303 RepID=UPI000F3ADFF4|nr:hypothetical protein [Pseudomonas putida]RNF66500.1 hypothetical protein EFJ98_24475 [Pseudomonas putida]